MNDVAGLLRLLGDEARLRLLRVLSREALNVTELTAILGLAQSGVSRHLGLLRDAGLIVEERAGTFTWYRLSPEAESGDGARAPLWAWLRAEFERRTSATRADDGRLEEVRRIRKENFSQHGGGDERRQLVPGRSWAAWARALGLLLPAMDVADLGCGEGYLTIEASRWARHVVSVDQSPDVLARARALAARRKVSNVRWKRGLLERLPIADESVDLALFSQALHHADQPANALAEARRILRPAGRVLVLDLREHGETWVRSKLGDRWLGFDDDRLRSLIAEAGFTDVHVRVGARRAGDPFTVLIAVGTKANGKRENRAPRTAQPPRQAQRASREARKARGGGAPRAQIEEPPEESESRLRQGSGEARRSEAKAASSAAGRASGGGAPRAQIEEPPEESESSSAAGRASGGGAPRAGNK